MNVRPHNHRNSSIGSSTTTIWQVTPAAPMKHFWNNLFSPWRQCWEDEQPSTPRHSKQKRTECYSPTTSLDDEESLASAAPADVREIIMSSRPPLANTPKQRVSSLQFVVPKRGADLSCCSTKSRHKREQAMSEYPQYMLDKIISTTPHCELTDGELTEDEDEDEDFFDLSSSSSSSDEDHTTEEEYNQEETVQQGELSSSSLLYQEAWKYEWANQEPPPPMEQEEFVAPTYLPQTPVPPGADTKPIFVVGWAAVELLRPLEVRDDDEETLVQSLYFMQLIRRNDALLLQLCDEVGIEHEIPYPGLIRTEYRHDLYSLLLSNVLKIIPMPISPSNRLLVRNVSAGAQHDSILYLQFGLDAAARSAAW